MARKRVSRKLASSGGGGGAPLILLVEDNADQRELYATYLLWRRVQVAMAYDGLSAISLAHDIQPDAIVMDLSLPRLDGWEATRRLKTHPRTAHIPVIACTAHVFGASVERALEVGCDSYVVKPCLPETLFAEIRRLLAKRNDSARRA